MHLYKPLSCFEVKNSRLMFCPRILETPCIIQLLVGLDRARKPLELTCIMEMFRTGSQLPVGRTTTTTTRPRNTWNIQPDPRLAFSRQNSLPFEASQRIGAWSFSGSLGPVRLTRAYFWTRDVHCFTADRNVKSVRMRQFRVRKSRGTFSHKRMDHTLIWVTLPPLVWTG